MRGLEHKILAAKIQIKGQFDRPNRKPTRVPGNQLASKIAGFIREDENTNLKKLDEVTKHNRQIATNKIMSKNPVDEKCSLAIAGKMLMELGREEIGKAADFYIGKYKEKAREFYDKNDKSRWEALKMLTKYPIAINRKEGHKAKSLNNFSEEDTKIKILEAFKDAHALNDNDKKIIIKPLKRLYTDYEQAKELAIGLSKKRAYSWDCFNYQA